MDKKILIVEDNELNLKLFRDLLEAHRYEVFSTQNGHEAFDLVHSVMPDLILMDIQLPEISGLEITKKIRSDNRIKNIPIIAVTAFAMRDDEQKILSAGCDAYIAKPIMIAEFIEKIRQFLDNGAHKI